VLGRALVLSAIGALAIALPAVAVSEPDVSGGAGEIAFDTPAPTPKPDGEPRPTPKAQATQEPTSRLGPASLPPVLPPQRASLTVGFQDEDLLGQLPLQVALLDGYFEEAGFDVVTLVRSNDTLRDVRDGELDFAVVSMDDALTASEDTPGLQAIAGYQNYAGRNGRYGGDLLMARPGLVAHEPATVTAFLGAYVRALQDLSDTDASAQILEDLAAIDLAIDSGLSADWQSAVEVFAPFDGGFGSADDEGGLGELSTYLTGQDGNEPDLDALVAWHTLSVAQARAELSLNPVNAYLIAPDLAEITIGVPLSNGSLSPITVADEAGYFAEVGFGAVEIVDVEQPLPGVMTAQVDLGIVDAVDAVDGATLGLPLRSVAGHQNYGGADGAYGGDLVVVSLDFIEAEPGIVGAFLIAYIRGLQDISDSAEAASLAPHDGGYGSRDVEGGVGELQAYLTSVTGSEPDLDDLIIVPPLELAQAWWGLPANPTDVPPLVGTDAALTDTEDRRWWGGRSRVHRAVGYLGQSFWSQRSEVQPFGHHQCQGGQQRVWQGHPWPDRALATGAEPVRRRWPQREQHGYQQEGQDVDHVELRAGRWAADGVGDLGQHVAHHHRALHRGTAQDVDPGTGRLRGTSSQRDVAAGRRCCRLRYILRRVACHGSSPGAVGHRSADRRG